MIIGFDHVAIICSSEESVDFYKKLGFHEILRKERQYDTVVILEDNGIRLELFIDDNHPARATNPENMGLRHLALRVDNIEKTLDELDMESASIGLDWVGVRYTYIYDPDGLPIELHE